MVRTFLRSGYSELTLSLIALSLILSLISLSLALAKAQRDVSRLRKRLNWVGPSLSMMRANLPMLLARLIPQPQRTRGKRDGPNEWNMQDFGEYDISLDEDGGSGLTVSVVALTLLVQCYRYGSILPAFAATLSFV